MKITTTRMNEMGHDCLVAIRDAKNLPNIGTAAAWLFLFYSVKDESKIDNLISSLTAEYDKKYLEYLVEKIREDYENTDDWQIEDGDENEDEKDETERFDDGTEYPETPGV